MTQKRAKESLYTQNKQTRVHIGKVLEDIQQNFNSDSVWVVGLLLISIFFFMLMRIFQMFCNKAVQLLSLM